MTTALREIMGVQVNAPAAFVRPGAGHQELALMPERILAAAKACSRCGKTKPLEEFSYDKRKSDGRQGRCRACKRELDRAAYRRDPERYKRNARKAHERDPEGHRVRSTLWRASHSFNLPTADEETRAHARIIRADPCAYCGRRPANGLDHIEPLSDGAENHWANLAGVCHRCNSRKNARPLLVALLEHEL